MTAALTPLRCPACDGPVPLVDAATTPCASCGAVVTLPAAHVEALRAATAAAAARAAALPAWRAVATPRSPRLATAGVALVVVLPVIATVIATVLPSPPWARLEVLALAAVPAIGPGAALYLWVHAVNATVVRVADALVAAPPAAGTSAPSCRRCGAPLTLAPDAIAATCAYCGTDSLVDRPPLATLRSRLHDTLATLDQAVAALRGRRRALAAGGAAVVLALGAAAWLLTRAAVV